MAGDKVPLFLLQKFKFIIRPGVLFIWFVFIFSCQSVIRKDPCFDLPDSASKAAEFIASVSTPITKDSAVKGIGTITWQGSDGMLASRAAWLGASDGRFRIEMLGPAGHSVAKFIFDGKDYVFVSPLEQRVQRKKGAESNLKAITGISLSSEDIIAYMSGRIPLKDYDEAMFRTGGPGCSDTVVLKRQWLGVVEKLLLDETHAHVETVAMYRWGQLQYRVELMERKVVNGRSIPFRLDFSNSDQQVFGIDVEKCWLDIQTTPEMFAVETVGAER
jgi:hypothetical protein